MDAYSSYIVRLSEARLGELRREAAEYSASRAARSPRTSMWARARRPVRRRPPTVAPVAPVALPAPAAESDLRRTA